MYVLCMYSNVQYCMYALLYSNNTYRYLCILVLVPTVVLYVGTLLLHVLMNTALLLLIYLNCKSQCTVWVCDSKIYERKYKNNENHYRLQILYISNIYLQYSNTASIQLLLCY